MSNEELVLYLESYITKFGFKDSSHDLNHFKRVAKLAFEINEIEGKKADESILIASAYLHDIVSLPKNHPDRKQSSRLAADKAEEVLLKSNFPKNKIKSVKHCICAHSFSANITPETIEAKIIQDADRMEAIGAIGLARCFYVSGLMKRSLFESSDPFASYRELDDSEYAVDHFYKKLLLIKDSMQTDGAKIIARSRHDVLLSFLESLKKELEL